VLDLDWREAVLLGAVLAPTDAAAVFSVLRRVPLPVASRRCSRRSRASTTRRR
jgi:NhaP-type Na+/H+ and K+/H+ antiporter